MFPSRNNPRGGRKKHTAGQAAVATPKLYKPSIYNYTCYGMYYAASVNSSKSATTTTAGPHNSGSEGICKGIRSKLEVIETDHNRMTRVEALERFSTVITDFDGSSYDNGSSQEDGELHQHAEASFVSPVLIFRNSANNGKNKKPLPKEELLPQEQTTPTSETWSCYGATEVEYLVLQDPATGNKTITAVAPKNTGFSVRGIRSPDSQRTISRLGLGFLDVIHDSNTSLDATEADGSTLSPEEVPPRPSVDSLQLAKESLNNAIDFSGKVAQHMEMNLTWLGNNLMDDFPARTWHAGRQILHNLPGTCQSTAVCMRQLVGHLFGDDEDDGGANDRRR